MKKNRVIKFLDLMGRYGNNSRIMKCGVVFVFLLVLNLGVYAQTNPVTLDLKGVNLDEFVQAVKKQTNINFMYNSSLVATAGEITIRVEKMELKNVLDTVLKKANLVYEFDNNTVLIRPGRGQVVTKQQSVLKGIVKDEQGVPLPGVTVLVRQKTDNAVGTSVVMGTATDMDGKYTIMVPEGENVFVIFSFVGMISREIKYSGQKTLDVVMKEDVKTVNEVVVTGYGNMSKGNYTGASTTVKAENVLMAGVSSIDQMLQGVVPGMLVWNTTGQVGATSKIRVRGTSTLLGSQEPVWVVDGVIQQDPQPFNSEDNTKFSVDADDIKQLAGNAISWLNPNDIETITVLKDASATAIYGSKAANGVIVITTKKARAGKMNVNYSGSFSIGQRPRYGLYDLMNSQEMMQFSKEIYDERRVYPSTVLPVGYAGLLQKWLNKEITEEEMSREYMKMAKQNTDWFKLLFRNSFNHSHNVSISGGSERIQNRTSFGYSEEKGEAKGNNMTTFTATSNTTVNFGERLMINMLLKGTIRDVRGFAYGVDPFNYAYNTTRVIPAYNEDGSYYYHEKEGARTEGTYQMSGRYNYNILNELEYTGSKNSTRTWGTTIDLKWKILPGLEYQGLVSYTSSSADSKKYADERSFYITQIRGYEFGSVASTDDMTKQTPLPNGGLLETDLTNNTSIMIRNGLVYDRMFGVKHRMTLQVGIETNALKTKGNTLKRYGYLPHRGETFTIPPSFFENSQGERLDNSVYVNGGTQVINRVDNKLSEYMLAVYSYADRYVMNFSARLDASNRFAQDKNKRFEPTWSVGIKWRLGTENFLLGQLWINNLDLYGSYGYQGNAVSSVSPYLTARDGGYDASYKDYVLIVSSLPYPNLGWEKTKTYNIGIEGSLFDGRLNFTANYFEKLSDVLAVRDVAIENGTAGGVVSGTSMKNRGYDFVIDVVPIRTENFTWQLSVNTSVTRNKVDKNERWNTIDSYLNGSAVIEGSPFSTFYSFGFDKLNPENGIPVFKNMDVENGIDPTAYLVKSGKLIPDFSGGFNMLFKYKRISLYALFAVQWGGHDRLPELYASSFSSGSGLPKPEQNVSRKLLDRWKKAGDEVYTNIPSLPGAGNEQIVLPAVERGGYGHKNLYEMYNLSDVRVANTDFIRCRSLSLSYEMNPEWLKRAYIQRMQIKASMTNPFMWVSDKKWDGLDPETRNWPARRVTSLSLQVVF